MRGTTIEKKPSVDWKLLFTFTPSSVTLIVFCGRPLIVDPRGPPVVSTPGRNVTKFSALRETSGSELINSLSHRRRDRLRLRLHQLRAALHGDGFFEVADLERHLDVAGRVGHEPDVVDDRRS